MTLVEKLLMGETVQVLVERTGKPCTIRPTREYSLPTYDILVGEQLVRRGVILSQALVQQWCVGLLEIPATPFAISVTWRTEVMLASSFALYHERCWEEHRPGCQLSITQVRPVLIQDIAVHAQCSHCHQTIHESEQEWL